MPATMLVSTTRRALASWRFDGLPGFAGFPVALGTWYAWLCNDPQGREPDSGLAKRHARHVTVRQQWLISLAADEGSAAPRAAQCSSVVLRQRCSPTLPVRCATAAIVTPHCARTRRRCDGEQGLTSRCVWFGALGCSIWYSMSPPVTSKPIVDTGRSLASCSARNTRYVTLCCSLYCSVMLDGSQDGHCRQHTRLPSVKQPSPVARSRVWSSGSHQHSMHRCSAESGTPAVLMS